METGNIADPELLRYLSGEISFDTWLEKQDVQPMQSNANEDCTENYGNNYFDGDSAIFSSWGNAFTSTSSTTNTRDTFFKDDAEYLSSEDNVHEEKDQLNENVLGRNVTKKNADNTEDLKNNFRMPSSVDDSEKEGAVQGFHIHAIAEKLFELIQKSTVRKVLLKESKTKKNEEIPDIMKDFQAFQLRKYSKARHKLPELCRNQMGQANLLVAKGDFKQAAEICLNVIKEAPSSGQPFKTLSFIYEEQGDKEMSLQYSLISAFLDCKDANEWVELAKKCSDAGNIRQTLACYDRACKFRPGDLALQWERCVLYFENKEYRKCLDIYHTVIKLIIPEDKQSYIEVSRSVAKIFHELGLADKAADTLQSALSVCSGCHDVEAVHLLSEVLIGRQQYMQCLKLFANHTAIGLPESIFKRGKKSISPEESEESLSTFLQGVGHESLNESSQAISTNIINSIINEDEKAYFQLQPVSSKKADMNGINVPNDLPLDLRGKLCVCLIYCKQLELANAIIEPIYVDGIENSGDLILDIAEAFLEIGQHEEALKHLTELTLSQKYNQAAIWLKIAECHDTLQNSEETISAYYKVLTLAPLQVGVRFALSTLLRKVGREDESMAVLAEYVEVCRDDNGFEQKIPGDENRLEVEMLKVSVRMKESKKALSIIEKAILFKPFGETKRYRLDLDYLMVTTLVLSHDFSKAFDAFRVLLLHENDDVIERNTLWILFTVIANKMLDKRHHRFTIRYLFRKPKFVPQIIRNGNNSHMSGTYKYAIGEFSRAFRHAPTLPLNSLLLGISFLHLACQKFATMRHSSILQGLVFILQYVKLRGENQEAFYNLGRAFHQIGLVHFAVQYYKKALEYPLYNTRNGSTHVEYHPHVDLHREAAFNLSVIYKASGNVHLARDVLLKYCWV